MSDWTTNVSLIERVFYSIDDFYTFVNFAQTTELTSYISNTKKIQKLISEKFYYVIQTPMPQQKNYVLKYFPLKLIDFKNTASQTHSPYLTSLYCYCTTPSKLSYNGMSYNGKKTAIEYNLLKEKIQKINSSIRFTQLNEKPRYTMFWGNADYMTSHIFTYSCVSSIEYNALSYINRSLYNPITRGLTLEGKQIVTVYDNKKKGAMYFLI